jgi:hypothetical protein
MTHIVRLPTQDKVWIKVVLDNNVSVQEWLASFCFRATFICRFTVLGMRKFTVGILFSWLVGEPSSGDTHVHTPLLEIEADSLSLNITLYLIKMNYPLG